MDSPASFSCSVIVIGAGVSGIMAAKVLVDSGVKDIVILEATGQIGGRLQKRQFGGITVEAGAGWVQGVGGKQMNPIWELAQKHNLRSCYSDYSNAKFNIYDQSGSRIAKSVAAASYDLAVRSANRALAVETSTIEAERQQDAVSILSSQNDFEEFVPSTPLELAIDFILNDFEMAEVEPIPTYTDFGVQEYLIADDRGYDYILHNVAQGFLKTNDAGELVDERLKLEKVVREIQHTSNGVSVKTEDGWVYNANHAIVSVSLGVLQSELIKFVPDLPKWKMESFHKCDIRIYTKIFLKFSRKFWPIGPGTEFFLYADEKRGYYTFWQHMENAYPGSNMLVVTVTNDESKRIEQQSDKETMAEAMAVLKKIFGDDIPDAEDILVPRWWDNRFQRGSYTNYPVFVNSQDFQMIRVNSSQTLCIALSSISLPKLKKLNFLATDLNQILACWSGIEIEQAPVGPIYFTGEHTSERFNGYVHGAYLSGIDTANMLVESMTRQQKRNGQQNNSYHTCQNRFDSAAFQWQVFCRTPSHEKMAGHCKTVAGQAA